MECLIIQSGRNRYEGRLRWWSRASCLPRGQRSVSVINTVLCHDGSGQSWADFAFPVLLFLRGNSALIAPLISPSPHPSFSLSVCHSVHVRHASGPHQSIDPGQQFTWEHSNLEVNKPKNRYANVIAYDHSRVILAPIEGKADPRASDMSSGLDGSFGKFP